VLAGCYSYDATGNTVCGRYGGGNTGGGVKVSTPTPYTKLTITGAGDGYTAGFGFDLCFQTCLTTTTTTTASPSPYCAQYSWDLTGAEPTTETNLTISECVPPFTSFTITDTVENFILNWSSFCSATFPVVTLGTIAQEGICTLCDPIVIGTQSWDCSDLRVTEYANGDPIPEVTDGLAWAALTTGAWCWYDNDPNSGIVLYNWYAINDPRGLAPAGKHIPTEAEWITLINYLGGSTVAGGALKDNTLAPWGWNYPNTGATNSSGFSAFPSGLRNYYGGFDQQGNQALYWAADNDTTTDGYIHKLSYISDEVFNEPLLKVYGASVRLLND
jgi:uncharacterized protein (TIGR02145 family)